MSPRHGFSHVVVLMGLGLTLGSHLASAQTPDTTGHIDVTFEVTKFGRARRVEVLASTVSASREAEKDLIRRISNSVFRPRVVDGRVADAAPVVLRYYVRE